MALDVTLDPVAVDGCRAPEAQRNVVCGVHDCVGRQPRLQSERDDCGAVVVGGDLGPPRELGELEELAGGQSPAAVLLLVAAAQGHLLPVRRPEHRLPDRAADGREEAHGLAFGGDLQVPGDH